MLCQDQLEHNHCQPGQGRHRLRHKDRSQRHQGKYTYNIYSLMLIKEKKLTVTVLGICIFSIPLNHSIAPIGERKCNFPPFLKIMTGRPTNRQTGSLAHRKVTLPITYCVLTDQMEERMKCTGQELYNALTQRDMIQIFTNSEAKEKTLK